MNSIAKHEENQTTKKLDLNLVDQTKYNILYRNVVASGMPALAAEQIVRELRKRGLSPFPNIFKVPNVRAKIVICYLDWTFVAQAGGLEFLGLTNFQVVKSGQKINLKIDRQQIYEPLIFKRKKDGKQKKQFI